jgi:hypothetical protein
MPSPKKPSAGKKSVRTVVDQIKASSGAESASMAGRSKIRAPRRSATDKDFNDRLEKMTKPKSRAASAPQAKVFATVGSHTYIDPEGKIVDDPAFYNKLRIAKANGSFSKQAGLFMDGGLGNANIGDSENLQSYNFEFPNDALELPQSRREELRYFRIAYDRDPLVGRAIDLHTELPLAKLILEKPKCSTESFADFVFDWFQGWANDTKLFEQLLHGTREYFLIGEGYFFIEHTDSLEKFPICPVAKRQLDRKERMRGPSPEASNPTEGVDELSMYQWSAPGKGAKLIKEAATLGLIDKVARQIDLDQQLPATTMAVFEHRKKLASAIDEIKTKTAAALKLAAPPTPPAEGDAPAPMMDSPLQSIMDMRGDTGGEDAAPEGGDDAAMGDDAGGGDLGGDMGGGGMPPMGGGGGMGGPMGDDMGGGMPVVESEHVQNLRRYLKLLERKKELLEELRTIKEEKKMEWELFSHVTNPEYWGPDRIVLLPPDVVEIRRDKRFNAEPTICYRPSEELKATYMADDDVSQEDKDMLEAENLVPLNDNPVEGSYVLQFARKKAPFEDHGRSVLQRCLRTIIYRDKLRQVQNTLASRHMTPITLVVAPDAPVQELDALRVHIDEAKHDPDYSIVVNYEVEWKEMGAEGRLLALGDEWSHTSSELAVGMGFTPEILTGEGFVSNDHMRVELMNTTYTQYRDVLSELVETQIFRPIAMRKGFYEIDDYGSPRWIYPKLSFTRLALRDQGDVYDMLFNLYAKGSLPVDIIYEFLNLDPETCKRKLEEDIMTVKDSKFNQVLDTVYAAVGEALMKSTDMLDKITKSLGLKTKEVEEQAGPEGTGEGM